MNKHKDLIRLLQKQFMNIVLFPLRIFPVKNNRLMFVNGLSFNYAGNPKAVLEYIIDNYKNKYQLFIAVSDVKHHRFLKEKGITPVKYRSLSYYFYALTSKVFLTDAGGYSFLPIKKAQYVINTWHGGGAYKKGGLDVCENTPAYIKDVKMLSKKTSLFLTTCSEQTKIFERAYLIPKDRIWEIGMPRNDSLFKLDTQKISSIKKQLGFNTDDKIVFYAPTFRVENDEQLGNMIAGNYNIDIDLTCRALNNKFGGNWRFAYRLHPAIASRSLKQFDDAINLSDYPDMQNLLLIADVLINDYSSSMWDFNFTKRPCFIFASDIEHYMKTTSWYTPLSEWPYPIATNNLELETNILNFDSNAYSSAVDEHVKTLGLCEDGTATEKLCKKISEICFSNQKNKG